MEISMTQTRAVKSERHIPNVIIEHALEHRYRRGDIAIDHKAPDIESPKGGTVSLPRVVCAYDRMHSRGVITDEQREAADKYAIMQEVAIGARWENGHRTPRTANQWDRGHPTISQVQAITSLRHVEAAMGKRATRVAQSVIMENLTAKALGEMAEVDQRVAQGWVIAAFERMAEHWGMVEKRERD